MRLRRIALILGGAGLAFTFMHLDTIYEALMVRGLVQ